jgi:hypothetical protein
MTIECIGAPFTYRWPDGEVRLAPGRPISLPDDRAARLLEKAPGRVRVVGQANKEGIGLIGRIVTWDSPLFGVLSATVLEDLPAGVRVVHPLTETDCVIPRTWLRFSPFSPFSLFFPDKS